jgi:5-bromo-4-chloroindolyl phosphate hydrolysis protein
METTKHDVRSNFSHARYLMQEANKIMKGSKHITDFSNDSDAGQICNELVACVATFQIWLDEMQEQINNNKKGN